MLPPERITITRLLSTVGSQKVVFQANWTLTQRAVVLKEVRGDADARERITQRESQSHPLSMAHPNIIETFVMRNLKGEPFLVEERLPEVLNDAWRCHGIQEAANLLYDVSSALHYLHSDLKWVHGDIKPDNIGKRGGDYIVLDFGICRPIEEFVDAVTPTGSLRTRAPELLLGDFYRCPKKADMWALGATIYNTWTGRFPLFDPGEKVPRLWEQAERRLFEERLTRRTREEWEKRVDLSLIPPQIRSILQQLLEPDPEKRWSAAQVLSAAGNELAGFLRNHSEIGPLSPLEELDQLVRYLPDTRVLRKMPITERHILVQKLKRLAEMKGASEESAGRAAKILKELF